MLEFRKRTARLHGIKKNGSCNRKSRVKKLANCTLRDLAAKLDVHGRHCMLSYLSSLPISVLRSLDTEVNKFYDRTNRLYDAVLLKRCYTQHALHPVIDSKINHIRHFIEISFINKGMDYIIYRVFSEINRCNHPHQIISRIMKYQSFVINIINLLGALYLIFNKFVSDLDTETCNPDSNCKDSKYVYPAAGHVCTGNLRIIVDSRIRSIIAKGPKYRFPVHIDFQK